MRVGILTISDRVASGEYEDVSGPAIADYLHTKVADVESIIFETVADDLASIVGCIESWCDSHTVDILLTTGGTGLTQRDLTPEATLAVVDRVVPGLAEAMRAVGRQYVATADLSRQVAGQRGRTLVVNLPGSPKGAVESLAAVAKTFIHAVELMNR